MGSLFTLAETGADKLPSALVNSALTQHWQPGRTLSPQGWFLAVLLPSPTVPLRSGGSQTDRQESFFANFVFSPLSCVTFPGNMIQSIEVARLLGWRFLFLYSE